MNRTAEKALARTIVADSLGDRRAVGIVVFLTLIGGAFRFATITRPGIWYDEAQTYRRVCGSFAQMMQQLRSDGFMPLHYWVEWGLAQMVGGAGHLTPFWLRFPAALAGTLMVPAMYWLAIQFCNRRAAMLVAAFTACSAYLNFYSHDAKMYMPLWLFCALSMTCLLVWQRTGKTLAWAGWVSASIVTVGLHAVGLAIIALELLAFVGIIARRHRRQGRLMVLGIPLILAGPLFYCLTFNRWAKNVRDAGWEGASGLHWVPNYNAGRSRANLLAYPTTAYLTGWEWPARGSEVTAISMSDRGLLYRGATHGYFIPPAIRITLETVNVTLLVLVVAPCLVRMRRWRFSGVSRRTILLGTWLVLPVLVLFEVATHPNRAVPFHGWAGVWMPRYLGIVWPAGAILVCTLLTSLPTSILRSSGIALLLGVNCAQSVCRVAVQTRPPVERMMQDVWACRDPAGASRTYIPREPFDPEGDLVPGAGKYYLCLAAGRPLLSPADWLKNPAESMAPIHASDDISRIVADSLHSPQLQELTVWRACLDSGSSPEDIEWLLGAQWKKTSEETYSVRGVWNWSNVYVCTRTHLVRLHGK